MPDYSGLDRLGASVANMISVKKNNASVTAKMAKEDDALNTLTSELERTIGKDAVEKSGMKKLVDATKGMPDRFSKLSEFITIRKALTSADETPDNKQKRDLNTDLIKRGQSPIDANDPDFTKKAAGAFAQPNLADKTSAEEKKLQGKANVVMSSIDNIKKMVNDPKSKVGLDRYNGEFTGGVSGYLNQLRVDSNTPLFVAGDKSLNELQGYVGALRSNTLFGQAGTALTPTERQVIEPLINITGKTTERINQDLDAFKMQWGAMLPELQKRLAAKGVQLPENESNPFGDASASVAQQNAPASGIQEGATATNPTTKEKIVYKGGQWQPMGK